MERAVVDILPLETVLVDRRFFRVGQDSGEDKGIGL